MILYGPLYSLMVPYGPVRSRKVMYIPVCSLRSLMFLFGPLWYPMVLFGPVLFRMVLFGLVWSYLFLYWPVWSLYPKNVKLFPMPLVNPGKMQIFPGWCIHECWKIFTPGTWSHMVHYCPKFFKLPYCSFKSVKQSDSHRYWKLCVLVYLLVGTTFMWLRTLGRVENWKITFSNRLIVIFMVVHICF